MGAGIVMVLLGAKVADAECGMKLVSSALIVVHIHAHAILLELNPEVRLEKSRKLALLDEKSGCLVLFTVDKVNGLGRD